MLLRTGVELIFLRNSAGDGGVAIPMSVFVVEFCVVVGVLRMVVVVVFLVIL